MAMDPDMALSGSTGKDVIMIFGGITGYSYQAFPHYPHISSSALLHCTLILLFIFHFPTISGLFLVLLTITDCLESVLI